MSVKLVLFLFLLVIIKQFKNSTIWTAIVNIRFNVSTIYCSQNTASFLNCSYSLTVKTGNHTFELTCSEDTLPVKWPGHVDAELKTPDLMKQQKWPSLVHIRGLKPFAPMPRMGTELSLSHAMKAEGIIRMKFTIVSEESLRNLSGFIDSYGATGANWSVAATEKSNALDTTANGYFSRVTSQGTRKPEEASSYTIIYVILATTIGGGCVLLVAITLLTVYFRRHKAVKEELHPCKTSATVLNSKSRSHTMESTLSTSLTCSSTPKTEPRSDPKIEKEKAKNGSAQVVSMWSDSRMYSLSSEVPTSCRQEDRKEMNKRAIKLSESLPIPIEQLPIEMLKREARHQRKNRKKSRHL